MSAEHERLERRIELLRKEVKRLEEKLEALEDEFRWMRKVVWSLLDKVLKRS